MRVHPAISDMFFNLDFSQCKLKDEKGNFAGYDESELRDQADWFINCLDSCGIATPTKDDLIADFRARV